MRHFLIVAPLLLGTWATPSSRASAQPVVGITIVPPSLPNPWAPRIPTYLPTVICQLAVRPNVSVKPEPLGEVRLAARDNRSLSAGGFRFQASFGGGDGRYGSERRPFETWVYLEPFGKLIEQVLFDQPLDLFASHSGGVVSHTATEHGFTGLHSLFSPSGAELQYWCDAE